MNEIWIDIVGYNGNYQISNLGRVKSIGRKVDSINHKKKSTSTVHEKILKSSKYRYESVFLSKSGISKMALVHRLIATVFIPNPENKPQVNHKNGNKLDNRIENLEWCNASENSIHAYKNNLTKAVKGELVGSSKLLESEASELLQLHYMYGLNQRKTAKEYNLCQATIRELLIRQTWKHL
ncbi:MAG TPA: NUMOD4 motif-containing HNH endonuclease [Cyclobacteriaceae bacterium]|jgi:hypothetical protein|nr:NUMOD4 motif-containing HNH endonuclease [Cyclobacteriaceae bacterium]